MPDIFKRIVFIHIFMVIIMSCIALVVYVSIKIIVLIDRIIEKISNGIFKS